MHVPTHILSGWCAASLLRLTPRERLFAMIAASAADVDGISILFGEGTYQTYHHLLGHNLLWAVVVAVVLAQLATNKLKAFVLYLALGHLHLVMDYFGSGPLWPIYYLWPFNGTFYFVNKNGWPFTSWQNTTVAAALLAWTIGIAYRQGRTPLELITPRLDRAFVAWLRQPRAVEQTSWYMRTSASALLAFHVFGCIAWLLLMPGGFRLAHPRFWVNQVLPWVVLAFLAMLIIMRWRRGLEAVRPLLLALPAAWLFAGISTIVVFPISGRLLAPMLLVCGAVLLAACLPTRRPRPRDVLVFFIAATIGALLPLSQRAGDPRTKPDNLAIDPVPADAVAHPSLLPLYKLSDRLRVQTSDGTVYLRCGAINVDFAPMLSFVSRSPDRCWTIVAPRDWRKPQNRTLAAMHSADSELRLWFDEADRSSLAVTLQDQNWAMLDARSHLSRPVWSHLNTFSELTIYGHKRLQIAFSPCGSQRFDVTHAGYPFGKPARLAYFNGGERFCVVEATNAEKGPFRELGSGRLLRGQPLAITLFDGGIAFVRLTFYDWSSQASDELSPTAGWGIPSNSIQFDLYEDRPTSPAGVWLSLADTGVGRGWDTVGHAAGTYRNRVRVERLTE
jgi:hypothetical protein